MLIFQLQLPHVFINSMQALRALSHLQIIFPKAKSHINMHCLKHSLRSKCACQRIFCLHSPVSYDETAGKYPLRTSLQSLVFALL